MIERSARTVLSIARGLLTDLDLESVLQRVLDAAREITGAQYAALGVLDPPRRELERFLTVGLDAAARDQIGPLPRGRGVLGELIAHPAPLRLADVGAHPRSYGFPAGHPPMSSFLGVPVLVHGEPFGNLYLTDKRGGGEFTDEDEQDLVILAEFAGVAIDHARRFTGSETRRRDLQRTVDALDATFQIVQALGGQHDLDAILGLVAKRGRALVSARALVIEHQTGGDLVVVAGAGELPEGVVGERLTLRDSVASAALRTLRSQRLEDETNRLRFERHGVGRLGLRATAGLVVPLVFRGRAYGVLVAVDRLDDGPEFTADDQRLLETFASSAATALAIAQSVDAERRSQRLAAAEQERTRWARELHDETLQSMAALRVRLASAQRLGGPDTLSDAVGEAVVQLDAEIAGLRALITELRPAALDQLGLHAGIAALAERTRRDGLEVDVSIELADAPERLAPELETAIYRVVQEALTNARKHGGAERSVVEVQEDAATIRVTVRDDGDGFDATAGTEGFGLLGMRERVSLLGGTFEIESAIGRETVVHATFPVRRVSGALPGPVAAPRLIDAAES